MNVRIRQETTSDYAAVHKLLVDAFGKEDEARLVDMLRLDPNFVEELSLVATLNDNVIGYILFTKICIVENDCRNLSLALAPMAVDPAYQRMGIGGQMIREGHKRAMWLGFDSVIVLGHEHYYPRFGYKPADTWNIRCPYQVTREVFMGRELIEGSLENTCGEVEYARAFTALDN
jgi:putative acetyltransferase